VLQQAARRILEPISLKTSAGFVALKQAGQTLGSDKISMV